MNKKDTKINRNDMLELTRRMTLSRNCFVRAAGAYIDDEGYIDDTFNVSFKNMSKHDQQVNLDLAKTIPFSKTNEQLKCYKFPEGDMAYDSIHKLLMALSERIYLCECGNRMDRDVNAAVNILKEGKRIYKKCA